MKIGVLLASLLLSCNSLPYLVTDTELERASQTTLHEAEKFALEGDGRIVGALRGEGIPVTSYVPPEAIPLPPPMPPGTDWGEVVMLALTALGGSAGAIGYRAIDHRKKRKKAHKSSVAEINAA